MDDDGSGHGAGPIEPDSRIGVDPVGPVLHQPMPAADAHGDQRWALRRFLTANAIDRTPLRTSRDFRLLFAGGTVTFLGSMITYVALPFQMYRLTGSSLMVALLSLAELAPLLVTALVGGALADARDRRRMLLLTEAGSTVVSALLLTNALLPEPQVWALFALSAAASALDGLQRPSLEAMIPRIVPREQLTAASALASLRYTAGQVAGPPLGGLLIAVGGLPLAYGVDVVSFAFSLGALALMSPVPPAAEAEPPSLRGVADGARYAWSRKDLLGTYLTDTLAMLFGMPMALFPAIADRYGGAGVLGLLYAAPEVGSLLATVSSGWTGRVHRHGVAILWAAAGWGLAVVAFGVAGPLWFALVALVLAGAADMVSGIFRMTMWNQTIPDAIRGRMAGIEMLSYSVGPLAGNVESGVVAALTSIRFSVVSGGVLCIVGVGLVAVLIPPLRHYDARRAVQGT